MKMEIASRNLGLSIRGRSAVQICIGRPPVNTVIPSKKKSIVSLFVLILVGVDEGLE